VTISAWIIYAIAVSVVLAAAGWCLEGGLSRLGLPTRWVWAGVLGLSILLPIWAFAGPGAPAPEVPGSGVPTEIPMEGPLDADAAAPGLSDRGAWPGSLVTGALMEGGVRRLSGVIAHGAALVPSSPRIDRWAVGLWAAGSVAVAVLMLASLRSLHRRKKQWPRSLVRNRTVRIAPALGPAVIGVGRPEIVLPRWARKLGEEELEMILAHEEEHIRARDPLLLTGALVAVSLVPWNPAVWWQLRRLRGAVEVDCDRRVLRHGARPRPYGELLLHLGGSGHLDILPTAALAGSPSLLERRLNAMKKRTLKRTIPPALAGAVLAVGLVVVACQTDVPTAADEEIEAAPSEAAPTDVIVIDGVEVTARRFDRAAEQRFFDRDGREIAREAVNLEGVVVAEARLLDRDEAAPSEARMMRRSERGLAEAVQATDRDEHRVIIRGESSFPRGNPLYVVDGVPVPIPEGEERPFTIDMNDVEEVSVLRGNAATALYGDRAQHGAIIITTRSGADGGGPDGGGPDPRSP
jgi:TonB-dependent SusC/RagA subfamily outer membrane receptor